MTVAVLLGDLDTAATGFRGLAVTVAVLLGARLRLGGARVQNGYAHPVGLEASGQHIALARVKVLEVKEALRLDPRIDLFHESLCLGNDAF